MFKIDYDNYCIADSGDETLCLINGIDEYKSNSMNSVDSQQTKKATMYEHSESYTTDVYTIFRENGQFFGGLHSHREFQITFIIKGHGNLIINEQTETFKPGDVFIIGPGIPHMFEPSGVKSVITENAFACFMYLKPEVFGKDGFGFQDAIGIRKLLFDSTFASRFITKQMDFYYRQLQMLESSHGIESVLLVLTILHEMALESIHTRKIIRNESGFSQIISTEENDKVNRVYEYLANNYMKEIDLNDLAEMACMSVSTFSRHFRRRTGQSYIAFLTDLRIGHATRLLSYRKHSIAKISAMTGFKSVSHFNRTFKKVKGNSPMEYLKSMQKKPKHESNGKYHQSNEKG